MASKMQYTWLLEFLIRQPQVEDNFIKRLLPVLPLAHTPRLTKTLLVRRVSSDVQKGFISWRLLEALELIHQMDTVVGATVLDSLNDAYCAVAFHCTFNLFKQNPDSFEHNARVWSERVLGMLRGKGVSLDSYVPAGGGDTRDAALKSLQVFLQEATAEMGPSFLELAATKLKGKDGRYNFTKRVATPEESEKVEMGRSYSAENSNVPTKKCKTVLTPEFRQVREALKSSMVDLNGVVKDPLPDALCMAANISRNMEKERMNDALSAENQNEERVSNVPSTGNQNELDTNNSDHFVDKECQNMHVREGNTRNSRPSLMERNNTAQTLEWDESPSPSRPHLPTPNHINVSPLNRHAAARNNGGRRRKKMWSSLEEETLIQAVKEHGRGNWTRILDEYREIFDERTPGDLKDKWRNLTK